MPHDDRSVRLARLLLTIGCLEFFGPILRDSGASHAMNPTWVGHARLHLVWLLGFMGTSGLVNLWLLWGRRPPVRRRLWLSAVWQSCNLAGFWIAYVLVDAYGGVVTVPGEHMHVLGWDENVLAFTVLTAVMVAALVLLARAEREAARA